MNKFLVYVQTQQGRFLRAFTFTGDLQKAAHAGIAAAWAKGVAQPDVQVTPIANQ